MHLVAVGGSDAGISAALRARELHPAAEVTVVVADAYPNFSICGIPYYVSGEVPRWEHLAHRTVADLEATGMDLRLDTLARRIDPDGHTLTVTGPGGAEELLAYDALVVGTGAVPVRPPVAGLDELGPADGVHVLHSMGDTFAVMATLEERAPERAVVVGAGYVGLEMAEGLTARGLAVTQMEQLPEVLPTVDPSSAGSCAPSWPPTAWRCSAAPRSPAWPAPRPAPAGASWWKVPVRTARSAGLRIWSSWWWASARTPGSPPGPASRSAPGGRSRSTGGCAPTCPTSSPRATA